MRFSVRMRPCLPDAGAHGVNYVRTETNSYVISVASFGFFAILSTIKKKNVREINSLAESEFV